MKLGGFPERIWAFAARSGSPSCWPPACCSRPISAPARRCRRRSPAKPRSTFDAGGARPARSARGAGSAASSSWAAGCCAATIARFGGISAMHVENGRVTALSDAGTLFRFALPGAARPGAARSAAGRPRPGDSQVEPRHRSDAGRRGDSLWIGVRDAQHDLALPPRRPRAAGGGAAGGDAALARSMAGPRRWSRLADGRFLVFAEGRDDGRDHSDAVLFDGDPADPATPAVRAPLPAPAGLSGHRRGAAARRPAAAAQPALRPAGGPVGDAHRRRGARPARRRDDRGARAGGAARRR